MEDRTDNWEELVQSQENRLYRAALAILGSRQEAEDAVQDTFLAFWEKAPAGLRDEGAWLTRVLVNNCRSRLRTSRRGDPASVGGTARPGAGGAPPVGGASGAPASGPGCDPPILL